MGHEGLLEALQSDYGTLAVPNTVDLSKNNDDEEEEEEEGEAQREGRVSPVM